MTYEDKQAHKHQTTKQLDEIMGTYMYTYMDIHITCILYIYTIIDMHLRGCVYVYVFNCRHTSLLAVSDVSHQTAGVQHVLWHIDTGSK